MAAPHAASPAPGAAIQPAPTQLKRESLRELLSLYRYVRPYRGRFAAGLLFLVLSSLTTLAFPYVIGNMVDAALHGRTELILNRIPNTVDNLALLLVGILVLQATFSFFRILWFVEVGERSLADLRRDLFTRLVQLPMAFFAAHRVGELSSRISSDVAQIQDTLTSTLAEFLRGIANLLIGVAVILFISPMLSLVMLATFPLLMVAAVLLGRRIRRFSKQAQDRLADAQVVVEESLQGIQAVKSFAQEGYERTRYANAIQQVVRLNVLGARYRGGFASFVILALFGAIVLVFWYGSRLVQAGTITVGDLTSFLIYTMFVGAAVGGFGEQYAQLLRTIGATERVRELLREPVEPVRLEHPVVRERLAGAVEFDDVHFRYPGRSEVPVLQGIHLQAQPGEKVALVGPSGAGKSTLVALLLRFYAPTAGEIRYDGKLASTYDLSWLRSQMAIVPQEVMLFGGSIRDNIAYGKLDASDADIREAARQANALEFIDAFPEGFDTIVGERGIKLSGGQRQRIAIARAVLRNPAILLLDEATSSLDSESERLVQEALEQLMQGRTTFIIAHRLSTVRTADQIVVLQHGRVVEQGTHLTLMAKPKGLYRTLAALQFQTTDAASPLA